MTRSIDFYFDFSSPYGFFGSLFVDEMAAGAGLETKWHPFLMGAAMKETGLPVLFKVPYKRDYVAVDVPRFARQFKTDFALPSYFPFMSVKVCRAFYAIDEAKGHSAAKAFAKAALAAAWNKGPDITDADVLIDLAAETGLDFAELAQTMTEQPIKDKLRAATQDAMARGCWGSPHFFINDGEKSEHFWGCDKRGQMEAWLREPW